MLITVAAAPTNFALGSISAPIPRSAPLPTIPTAPSPSPSPPPASPASISAEQPEPPHIPLHQTLHFHYGGYGGVDAHYSPAGEILTSHQSESDDPIGDLQYLPEIALDLCTPVLLVVFYENAEDGCVHTFYTMVYPRDTPEEDLFSCTVGTLVLDDFLNGLEAKGVPTNAPIERFLDATNTWVRADWKDNIPIYGRNRVFYIRTLGLHITPPDHFLELFPSISNDL
ncbi:hypothetical protein DFH06DRAFT_1327687 [Mycena polygramma]|nr:hypothetical protein DFH06DRAFT_1327687 [Mycena polygramma]